MVSGIQRKPAPKKQSKKYAKSFSPSIQKLAIMGGAILLVVAGGIGFKKLRKEQSGTKLTEIKKPPEEQTEVKEKDIEEPPAKKSGTNVEENIKKEKIPSSPKPPYETPLLMQDFDGMPAAPSVGVYGGGGDLVCEAPLLALKCNNVKNYFISLSTINGSLRRAVTLATNTYEFKTLIDTGDIGNSFKNFIGQEPRVNNSWKFSCHFVIVPL